MSGKPKKVVSFPPEGKKLTAETEIPARSEVLEVVPIIDPMTGQLIYVPLTEEYRRKHDTTTREEQMAATIEARAERNIPWWQRGYKNPDEVRKNKKGGKTKKRRNKKRRTTRR